MHTGKQLKYLLITFDYELFLGKKSGTVDKCVLEPTQKILDILAPYKAKAIFFVDTAWLVKLKQEALKNTAAQKDYDKVKGQLQQLVKSGYYVFNHLHPHWLDAQYYAETNQWELANTQRYRFADLDKQTRDALFADTVKILEEIIQPAAPGYKAEGYRAGGWSIQPFGDFIPYFRQYDIKHDFSVMPGMKSITTAQQYDFTGVANDIPYRFSDNPCEPGNGDFTEYPISTLKETSSEAWRNRILLKYLWIKGDRYSGDGAGIAPRVVEQTNQGNEMASIELLTRVKLPSYLRFLKKHDYMQLISHPKMLPEHNISIFALFMKKAFNAFDVKTDFHEIRGSSNPVRE